MSSRRVCPTNRSPSFKVGRKLDRAHPLETLPVAHWLEAVPFTAGSTPSLGCCLTGSIARYPRCLLQNRVNKIVLDPKPILSEGWRRKGTDRHLGGIYDVDRYQSPDGRSRWCQWGGVNEPNLRLSVNEMRGETDVLELELDVRIGSASCRVQRLVEYKVESVCRSGNKPVSPQDNARCPQDQLRQITESGYTQSCVACRENKHRP